MTFDDIPAGAAVFIDANCLVYAAAGHHKYGAACKRLLIRIENKDLQGYTSSAVLSDMAHRLMTLEAAMTQSRPMTGIANWLRRHSAAVQALSRHRQAIDDLAAIPLTMLSLSGPQVSRAADLPGQFGLLMNDALIVVVMKDNGLSHLASHDADFDRVPGIIRYSPV